MKPHFKILLLSTMVLISGCADEINHKSVSSRFLIEDCEDGNNKTLLGSEWYIATDSAKGAASKAFITREPDGNIMLTGEGYKSKVSFGMSFRLSKGDYSFNPFVICGFKLFADDYQPFDASKYSGVSYFFKGPAHQIRIETGEVTDFCYYSISIPASGDWERITVPFEKLSQPSWGTKVPFDISSVKGISWQISGNDNDSSTIMIDDIAFEESIDPDNENQADEITIQGAGIEMKATVYKPDVEGKIPMVIVLPGGTSASNIGSVYDHHKYFGQTLSSKGIAALVLDYSSDRRSFFDTLQIEDIGKAVEYCKALPFVVSDRVFLAGFSIGGANALRVAGSRDDIAGAACWFSPCDWRVSGGGYGVKKQPIEYCGNIKCPVLIFQGDSDKVTDVSQSRLLYDTLTALGKSAELVIYEGAAHGFTYEGAPSGNCVYNKEIAEESFLKVEAFIKEN